MQTFFFFKTLGLKKNTFVSLFFFFFDVVGFDSRMLFFLDYSL